ncbi:unnamed protein product [Effrenium voratum]|nr:unnamed protein product [Effrenium voratum]CAJ1450863.1 unnamed protein product [Effrenium voratum]
MPAQEWLLCFQECAIYSSAFDPGSIHCLRAWASHVAGAGFLQANGATMFLLFASPVYTDLRLPQSRYKIKVERWMENMSDDEKVPTKASDKRGCSSSFVRARLWHFLLVAIHARVLHRQSVWHER